MYDQNVRCRWLMRAYRITVEDLRDPGYDLNSMSLSKRSLVFMYVILKKADPPVEMPRPHVYE
jgi:hypothetical protein